MEEDDVMEGYCGEQYQDWNMTVLNKGSTCFLCLKDIFSRGNSNESDIQIKSELVPSQSADCHQLSVICRYLNLNVREIFPNLQNTSSRNISVKLCQACKEITGNLTDLCAELELLQMKVEYCLQSFSEKLEQSEPSSSEIQHNAVKILREELTTRSQKKLKHVIPKVKLTRQKLTSIRKPSPKIVKIVIKTEVTKTSKSEPEDPLSDDMDDRISEISNPIYDDEPPSFLVPPADPTKIVSCDICNSSLQSRKLLRHKSNHHIESFFVSSKLPELSMEHFKLFCEHVIKVEILSCTKIPNPFKLPRRQCPHCEGTYSEKYSLRMHLFSAHQEILAGKISALQKTSTLEEIKEMSKITGNDRVTCDACGETFAHDASYCRHKKSVCKYGPRIKEKTRKRNKCDVCGERFRTKKNLLEHKQQNHALSKSLGNEDPKDRNPISQQYSVEISFTKTAP